MSKERELLQPDQTRFCAAGSIFGFVSCVRQEGTRVSEGVICHFGRGHLEDDQVITCDQARHPQVTNHSGVSGRKAGENESVGKHILCFNDGASMSATFG